MLCLPVLALVACHSPAPVAPVHQEALAPEHIQPLAQVGTLMLDGVQQVPAILTATSEAEGYVVRAQALNEAPGFVSIHFKTRPTAGFYAVEQCTLGASSILAPTAGACSIYTYGTEAGMAWSQAQVPAWVQVKEENDKLVLVFNQLGLSTQEASQAPQHWLSGFLVLD